MDSDAFEEGDYETPDGFNATVVFDASKAQWSMRVQRGFTIFVCKLDVHAWRQLRRRPNSSSRLAVRVDASEGDVTKARARR